MSDNLEPPRLPWALREIDDLVSLAWVLLGLLNLLGMGWIVQWFRGTRSITWERHGHQIPITGTGAVAVVVAIAVFFLICTALCFYTCRLLRLRERRERVIVLAALSCLMPHSAVVGVLTLILVTRPKIRAQFADVPSP